MKIKNDIMASKENSNNLLLILRARLGGYFYKQVMPV